MKGIIFLLDVALAVLLLAYIYGFAVLLADSMNLRGQTVDQTLLYITTERAIIYLLLAPTPWRCRTSNGIPIPSCVTRTVLPAEVGIEHCYSTNTSILACGDTPVPPIVFADLNVNGESVRMGVMG